MGDGSMTTLTIADPEKEGIREYLKSLPSRNPEGAGSNGSGNRNFIRIIRLKRTPEIGRGFVTFKIPWTHPLCSLSSFIFYIIQTI